MENLKTLKEIKPLTEENLKKNAIKWVNAKLEETGMPSVCYDLFMEFSNITESDLEETNGI